MLFSIAKKFVLYLELKKIKKVRAKASKKSCNSWSNYSSDESDSESSLSFDSDWDTYRRPDGRKEMNRLDHAVTDNMKTNKYQLNEDIYNELTFENSSFNSSSGARDPLLVVTITLRGGKKHR